ncbi:MAG TPA: hypothetical protein VFQ91_18960 [Bryobacteraceae bacterium]|nr:hypothetical protein [Bryobacteraceae bacterium]
MKPLLPLLLAAALAGQAYQQRGYLDLRTTLFPQDGFNDNGHVIADALFRYEASAKLTPWFKLNGAIDARSDTHRQTERSARFDWQDRGFLRPAFSFRRFSATLHKGPVTIELGKQFIRWGKADILNPIDRFAPKDFLNVVDNEFLGVLAARLTIEKGSHTFDLVMQPRFTPSRTPLLNQRWVIWPAALQTPVPVVQGAPDLPGGVQSGARWNYLGKGYEMSLAFYEGHNHLPQVDARLIPGRVELFNRFAQMRMYGGAGAVPLPWFTVKAEGGYFTSTSRSADNYVLYVVQAERTIGEWTLVGGYSGEHVTASKTQFDFAPDRGLARAFIGRASYAIGTDRTVSGEAAIRQNGQGAWVKGEYTQTLSTHWQARASFTLIRGGADDFIGQYRRNSHAILGMRYNF